MGNDTRRGPKQPRDARCDDGWSRPLGQGTQRTTDTWTPRMADSWVLRDRHRTINTQRRRLNERNRSQEQNTGTRDNQRQSSRSQSRGRTTQQQPQKENSPRQCSIMNWMTRNDKPGEGSSRDGTAKGRRHNDIDHRASQPSRK